MAGEVIQFVDLVSTSATVRLDLNANGWSVLQNGTDVSPPTFTRSTVSTLLADGDSIPASAYGNRVVKLHLQLRNTSSETNAQQMQKLWRELDRPMNVLKWQPDPAVSAVFFRTYRSPDFEPAIFDHGIELFDLTINLVAEPFSYGPLEALSTVSVQSNPAVAQGKYLDITGVKGDVETPAIIKFLGTDLDTTTLPWQMVLGMRRRGTPSNLPFFLQAESMDNTPVGSNTTFANISTTFSPTTGTNGASMNFAVGDTLYANRLQTFWPATSNVDARGTYRVFARVSVTSTGNFGLFLQHGSRLVSNDPVTWTATATNGYADLGLIQVPEGNDPGGVGLAGDAIPAPVYISLKAARFSGTGSLFVDYLMFVPADDALTLMSFDHIPLGVPQNFFFDSVKHMVYATDSFGQIADINNTYYDGADQMLSPNQTNRLIIIRSLGMTTAVTDNATNKVDVTVSYYPRYLYVRPLST